MADSSKVISHALGKLGCMKKKQPDQKRWHEHARTIIAAQNRTLADVAREVHRITGKHEDTVYKWLRGDREPSIDDLRVVATAIGVTVSELLEQEAYFLTDDSERALIDKFRDMTQEEREMFAKVFLGRPSPNKDGK